MVDDIESNGFISGSLGLEILHPDGSKFVHPMPMEFESKVSDLLKALQDTVS